MGCGGSGDGGRVNMQSTQQIEPLRDRAVKMLVGEGFIVWDNRSNIFHNSQYDVSGREMEINNLGFVDKEGILYVVYDGNKLDRANLQLKLASKARERGIQVREECANYESLVRYREEVNQLMERLKAPRSK